MSGGADREEARRTASRTAEAAMAKVGRESHNVLVEGAKSDNLLAFIKDRFAEFVPNVSPMGVWLGFSAALTTVLGPVTSVLISSVNDDGSQASWAQPAGDFFFFVSGPGQFKSGALNLCTSAIHEVLHVCTRRGHPTICGVDLTCAVRLGRSCKA